MEMSTFEHIAPSVLPHARSVILYGGEPLMHHNFFAVLAGIKKYEIPFVGFITNGLLLDENAAKKIISAGIYRVIISIDGATKATYESVRRRARFENVMANVHTLNKERALHHTRMPLLGLNFVMMRRNVAEMPMLVEMASSMDVDIINFAPLTLHPFLGLEEEALRGEELTELYNSSLDKALEIARRNGIKIFAPPKFSSQARTSTSISEVVVKYLDSAAGHVRAVWHVIERSSPQSTHRIFDLGSKPENYVLCRTPWEIFEVQANGDVHTCFCGRRGRVGSLLDQTFDEIWKGEQFQSLRRSLSGVSRIDEICEKCPDRSRNKLTSSVFHDGIFGVDFWGIPLRG